MEEVTVLKGSVKWNREAPSRLGVPGYHSLHRNGATSNIVRFRHSHWPRAGNTLQGNCLQGSW